MGISRASRLRAAAIAASLVGASLAIVGPVGAQLGPVEPVTPSSITGGATVALGHGQHPALSGDGAVVLANSSPTSDSDHTTLVVDRAVDPEGRRTRVGARSGTVSGDGCIVVHVQRVTVPTTTAAALISRFELRAEDRCTQPDSVQTIAVFSTVCDPGPPALSHEGRFVAVAACGDLYRIDRLDLVEPAPEPVFERLGTVIEGDLDISANGDVIVVSSEDVPVVLSNPSAVDGIGRASRSPAGLDTPVGTSPPTERQIQVWSAGTPGVLTPITLNALGSPTKGESLRPSISGDGRWVAFDSDATDLPAYDGGRTPKVYLHDRDAGTTRLVGPAGRIGSMEPSLSADGRQLAYRALPERCPLTVPVLPPLATLPPLFVPTTFETPTAFQTLPVCPVAEVVELMWSTEPGLLEPERMPVSTDPSGLPITTFRADGEQFTAEHQQPDLSGNARYIAWTTDASDVLTGGDEVQSLQDQVVVRALPAGLAIDPTDFGVRLPLDVVALDVIVRNTGVSSVNPATIEADSRFRVVGGGTCGAGSEVPPGSSCTVRVELAAPDVAGQISGTLRVAEDADAFRPVVAVGRLTARVDETFEPTLRTSPQVIDPDELTRVIGRGFPPGSVATLVVHADPDPRDDDPGEARQVIPVAVDEIGEFRLSLAAGVDLLPGPHVIRVVEFDEPGIDDSEAPLLVVTATVRPQGVWFRPADDTVSHLNRG